MRDKRWTSAQRAIRTGRCRGVHLCCVVGDVLIRRMVACGVRPVSEVDAVQKSGIQLSVDFDALFLQALLAPDEASILLASRLRPPSAPLFSRVMPAATCRASGAADAISTVRWRVSPRSSSALHSPARPTTTAGSRAPARRILRAYPRPPPMPPLPHRRRKSICKECGGAGNCEHQRQRSRCKDCGRAGVCTHQRIRSQCMCGGAGIWKHQP
jgi:hypothetical protein